MHKVLRFNLPLLFSCSFFIANAQLSESFSDGDFTNNPTWTGSTDSWTINAAEQLQSNHSVANSAFYISTANTLATSAQWEMSVRLAFNPSSANYVDVFLTASATDLLHANTTGYFVRIGNTDDEIALYKKTGSSAIKIIDGADKILNSANNVLKIKVIRSASNEWTLYRDISGTGMNYIAEGSVTDATYTNSSFFGFSVKQSTTSFFQKHFFDDIEIKDFIPDVMPPAIQSVTATASNMVDVLFSEPVSNAEQVNNYEVNNSIGNPSTAVRDLVNNALVHLTFVAGFSSGVTNTITINNIKDASGNALINGTATFSFYIPRAFDVVIDEIFADPTPVVRLPDAEFIEIKNTSGKSINLQGWRLNSASTTSSTFPSYVLPADSFLIITSTSNATLFSSYGRVLGVPSFPSLDNSGTTLSLISKEGVTIHSVSYHNSWYQNDVKSSGGWSLEMIDTKNPCTGFNNWKASTDLRGGTPGTKNSVDGNNPDAIAPALVRAVALDSVTVILSFSEPIDSTKSTVTSNYTINDAIGTPVSAVAISPSFDKVRLALATPVIRGKVYTITANNIADCSGNIIQALKTTKFGLTNVIDSLDVVINELLFNPSPASVDYVEIYNRSNKIFDLKDLYIANRSSTTNALGSLRQLTPDNILFFPGDFYVISENGAVVKQTYMVKNPDNFINVAMPSFPDDKGVVVLLNAQGKIVDELSYNSKWHFELIDNKEGISLERIDYNKPTQNHENWHSAASTAGYGTPSYQNSQFRTDLSVAGEVTVTPKTFSPDNDGFEDYTTINYQLSEPGYVANITIFDAGGRPVKSLAKNATLALSGSFRWDGLDDKLNKLPVGVYIVYTEVFNLNGKKKAFKNTVVVAARF